MSFCKLLHGIESGNAGDLDTARSLYENFVHQGKAPEEILQDLAGSLGHVTTSLGTLCVELCGINRKQGKFIFLNEKSLEMANVGAGGKPCRGVGQEMK